MKNKERTQNNLINTPVLSLPVFVFFHSLLQYTFDKLNKHKFVFSTIRRFDA